MDQGVGDDVGDMKVHQAVDPPLAVTLAHDEPGIAELAELVGQSALFDAQCVLYLRDGHGSVPLESQKGLESNGVGDRQQEIDGRSNVLKGGFAGKRFRRKMMVRVSSAHEFKHVDVFI